MAHGNEPRHSGLMIDLAGLLTDNPLPYLIVAALVMVDAVFPLAPSETLLVAGGVLVSDGDVAMAPLVAAGCAGALAGHSLLYVLGASARSRLLPRLTRTWRGRQRVEMATRQLHERPWLLMIADFIPWGRTVLMSMAGATRLPRKKFLVFAAQGALVWASFFVTLGLVGGAVFESTWHSLALSLGLVILISVTAETVQRLLGRKRAAEDARSPHRRATMSG